MAFAMTGPAPTARNRGERDPIEPQTDDESARRHADASRSRDAGGIDAGSSASRTQTKSVTERSTAEAAHEASLARAAAGGDVDAFGKLVERYQRPMAALVSRMVANPDDVDDVVQELFLRAWRGLPNFRGDAQFSTWLYRIAVNTAIKHRGRTRNDRASAVSADDLAGGLDQIAAPDDAPASAGGDPFRATVRSENAARVRDAVASLPEKQRAVVMLHYFDGHSCEEIAKTLDVSVGTIWSRLHYACKRLKDRLGESF